MSIFSRRKVSEDKKSFQINKKKLGLCLSGGGARGFAHLGAIKAFEEVGLHFDYVSGTSAGSIVGSMYSCGYTYEQMHEFSKTISEKEIRNSRLPFLSSNSANIEMVVNRLLADRHFADLKTPFSCVAVDLNSGDEIILSSGHVAKAVSASCAVPLIFTPVEIGQYRLVDGGLLNTIPADVVRSMGAEVVISIDLNSRRGAGTSSKHLLDTLWTCWSITMKTTALKGTLNSDIVIEPDLSGFKSTSLLGHEEMIAEGYRATMDRINEIFETIKLK